MDLKAKPTIVKDQKTAILFGCEGYVGNHVLNELINHEAYRKVLVFSQTKQAISSNKVEVKVMSFQSMASHPLKGNDLFICYDASFFNTGGTNSIPQESYKYIPKIVLNAYKHGVDQLLLLSSKRAHPDALLFSHRIRGIIENAVQKVGFWSTHIFKPSILIGESLGQEWGAQVAGEISNRLNILTKGWLKKNQPIEAEKVAHAMVFMAQRIESGRHIYQADWLQDFSHAHKQTKYLKK